MRDKKKSNSGFEYVVEKEEQAKLCFGSTREKTIQFYLQPKHPNPSPMAYDLSNTDGFNRLAKRPCSKKGTSALAAKADRFEQLHKDMIPGPNKYDLINKWGTSKQDMIPFGTKTERRSVVLNSNPGVGIYNIGQKHCRRTQFQYNLGYPKMMNAVETICIPLPSDKCDRCLQIIKGDYWHTNYTNFLCQPCMADEKIVHEMYTHRQLKEYKKIRNCSFMHQHEGTTAAIRLYPERAIRNRISRENYLSLFMASGN